MFDFVTARKKGKNLSVTIFTKETTDLSDRPLTMLAHVQRNMTVCNCTSFSFTNNGSLINKNYTIIRITIYKYCKNYEDKLIKSELTHQLLTNTNNTTFI